MTVDEVFESLGYRKVEYNSPHTNEMPFFEWVSGFGGETERIRFVPDSQRVYIFSTCSDHPIPSPLSLAEITAIHMQCIELGWEVRGKLLSGTKRINRKAMKS